MITSIIKANTPVKNYKYANLDSQEQLLNTLEWSWVNGNKPLSTPYWADKIGNSQLENFIFAMCECGWLVSKANARAKWGEFKLNDAKIDTFVSKEQQLAYKTKARVNKYSMKFVANTTDNLVKTASGVRPTGLIRKGFAKGATQPFQLDVAPLVKYYDAILLNLTKSMDKIITKYPTISLDSTNYAVISKELLDFYIFNQFKTYNLEGNVSDSRGRSIYNGLSRVGNPIANKDFRACLVVPTPKLIKLENTPALKDIYLFIAELAGEKHTKSWGQKAFAGYRAYKRKELHDLDLTSEEDRKDLHENIWLERIYNLLDILFEEGQVMWDVPLELDATMSLAQVVGVLTNDARLLDRTNVINPEELHDAWFVEGVPRLHTKTVGTPVFYGSAQTATKLLRSKKLAYTQEHIKILNREFNKGAFGVIKAFKDFLIQHSNVNTPTFQMNIWDDSFEVEVNKFKPVGATVKAYKSWDSELKRPVVFLNHEVITVPDYQRFKLYYPTGLV